MKPLILSFFAVILCYSLLTNKEEVVKTEPASPALDENSVFFEVQPSLQPADSIILLKDKIAIVE